MTLVWSAEARKGLTERSAPAKPEKLAVLWGKVRASLANESFGPGRTRANVATRLAELAPDLAAAATEAFAWLDGEAVPTSAPSRDALALAAWVFEGQPTRVAYLFEIVAREFGLRLVLDASTSLHGLLPASGTSLPARGPRPRPAWPEALRRACLFAPESERRACEALAVERFEGATISLKITLAHAFFGVPELARRAAAEVLAAPGSTYVPAELLLASLTDPDLAEAVLARRSGAIHLEDFVAALGERALPSLFRIAAESTVRHELGYVASALSVFVRADVAKVLADNIAKSEMREVAVGYFLDHPALAPAALGPVAAKKGRPGALAADLLARATKLLDPSREVASAEGGAAPAKGTRATNQAAADLPWVLVRPPWEAKKSARPARTPHAVKGLSLLPRPERITIDDAFAWYRRSRGQRTMTDEERAAWEARVAAGESVPGFVEDQATVPDDLVIRHYNEGTPNVVMAPYQLELTMAAEFGVRVLRGLVRWLDSTFATSTHFGFLSSLLAEGIDSPRAAATMLRLRDAPAPRGDVAWRWFRRHPEAAFVGLIPLAVGGSGDLATRDDAERALHDLTRLSPAHEALGRKIAAEYGDETRAAVDEILAFDPRWLCPKKAPKLPASFRAETLSLVTKAGAPLATEAIERVGAMLAFSAHEPSYAGLVDVREACDPRSLGELAWAVAKAWEEAGRKKRDDWMLWSIAHFADEEIVRRTTPAIRDAAILDVLVTIGTDEAAMELATLVFRRKEKAYAWGAEAAEKKLHELAMRRGVSKDVLDDGLVPTLDVDEAGGLDLDYGSRTLRVGFDAQLAPFVLTEDGARAHALPPKRKTDDPEKVALAKRRWDSLKEDVATVAGRRIEALEAAMVRGRTWSREAFFATWVHHPLARHLAHGVIFVARSGAGSTPFRVAEDSTLADVRDAAFTLDADARVGVAHPIELGKEATHAFATVLGDYELVQPFEQLARTLRPLDPDAEEVVVEPPPGFVLRLHDVQTDLVKRGFRRDHDAYSRALARGGRGRARLVLEASLPKGTWSPPRTRIATLTFVDDEGDRLDTIDPVDGAETVHDVELALTRPR